VLDADAVLAHIVAGTGNGMGIARSRRNSAASNAMEEAAIAVADVVPAASAAGQGRVQSRV